MGQADSQKISEKSFTVGDLVRVTRVPATHDTEFRKHLNKIGKIVDIDDLSVDGASEVAMDKYSISLDNVSCWLTETCLEHVFLH